MSETGDRHRGLAVGLDLDRVVVIGASLAGLSAAESCRAAGFGGQLIVLEAQPAIAVDRPPLTKAWFPPGSDRAAIALPVSARVSALDLDVRCNNPVAGFDAASCRIKFRNDHELDADAVIVATGATPRRVEALEGMRNVVSIRDLEDAERLYSLTQGGPLRVGVLGAGFIGLEAASLLRGAGHEVEVFEAQPTPLSRVIPPEVGRVFSRLHRDHGVEVSTSSSVARFLSDGDVVTGLELGDGTVRDCDLLVLGIGAEPSTAWAEGSGLSLDNGIVTDETGRAAERVWACGDVARFAHPDLGWQRIEQWDHAVAMGVHVGREVVSVSRGQEPTPYREVPYFWSDQYESKLQVVGIPDPTDEVVWVEGDSEADRFLAACRRGNECRAVIGLNRARPIILARAKMRDSLAWDHVIGAAS